MSLLKTIPFGLVAALSVTLVTSVHAAAQQQQKPNIRFIMGDAST